MKNYDFNKADDVLRYAHDNLQEQKYYSAATRPSKELQEDVLDMLEWAKKQGYNVKDILERAGVPDNISKLLTKKDIDFLTNEGKILKKELPEMCHMVDTAFFSSFAERNGLEKKYIFCNLSGCPSAIKTQPDIEVQERIKQKTGHYDLSNCEMCDRFDNCGIWHFAVQNIAINPDRFKKAYGSDKTVTPSPTPTPETKRTITAEEVNDFIKSKGTVSPEELAEFLAMYDIITTKK